MRNEDGLRDRTVAQIVEWYVHDGVRGAEIARRLGRSSSFVYDALRSRGVTPSRAARLDESDVIERYRAGESLHSIGCQLGASTTAVRRVLVNRRVPIRSRVEALQPAGRRPCPRSATFRAYAFGFAVGDLAVERHGREGRTVTVRSSTTDRAQVALVRSVFGDYGPIRVSRQGFRVSLGESFAFLLSKYSDPLPGWCVENPVSAAAYAAGYIDAEGSFGVYSGRGRFKCDSMDAIVLEWMSDWLAAIGVVARHTRIAAAGEPRPGMRPYPRDLFRVTVGESLSLLRLIGTLDPFLRHGRRRATMDSVRANVIERLRGRDPTQSNS